MINTEAAIAIAQEAENRRSEIEENRIIPTDIMNKVKDAGLIKLWATKECGGAQASVNDLSLLVQKIAYHNGSLAWVIGVTECASLLTGYLSPEMSDTLFNDKRAMIGGYAAPSGQATPSGDNLIVSGHWTWGSGIKHCTHIVGGVFVVPPDGQPYTALVFFQPDEIEYIDNWHVLGLKGTNSIDYKAKQATIPRNRWVKFPISKALHSDPLYQFSYLGALSISVASVAIGLANRAFQEAITITQTKKSFGMGKELSKKPEIQQEMGRIQGVYLSANALMESTIRTVESAISQGKSTTELKAQIRLTSCHATQLCAEVVRSVYQLAGGSAIWQGKKIEELMRDINVVTQHGMVSTGNYRTAGAVAMGQKVPDILL